jgi:hypothetical protein
VVVLGLVLLISVMAVLAFMIIPLAARGRIRERRPLRLVYFVSVGLGYILIEIAFIQRFVLFLGHPTYALTVVVFLLLLSSGVGSLVSRKWLVNTTRARLPLAIIVAAILVWVFVLPALLNRFVGTPFAGKLLVSGLLLVPLGLVMGMPFPTGLRALIHSSPGFSGKEPGDSIIEWAWAMNAAASVLGSVLAMVIAIQFGLNITLASGAGAYLLALAVFHTLSPGVEPA